MNSDPLMSYQRFNFIPSPTKTADIFLNYIRIKFIFFAYLIKNNLTHHSRGLIVGIFKLLASNLLSSQSPRDELINLAINSGFLLLTVTILKLDASFFVGNCKIPMQTQSVKNISTNSHSLITCGRLNFLSSKSFN